MDRWSTDKMSALKAKCYPNLPREDYDRLLMIYGPIPRWVLEQTYESSSRRNQWSSHMDKALGTTDLQKSLISVMNESSADDLAVSHIVIHQTASSDFLTCTYSVASVWVAEQVSRTFKWNEPFLWIHSIGIHDADISFQMF